MSLIKVNSKTIARIAAVQTIYQYKPEDLNQSIDLIIQQMIQLYQSEQITNNLNKPIKIKLGIGYFKLLVKSVILNLPQIDKIILRHLTSKWQITSLPILLLALLRVAICELQFLPDVPSKVVINEFTNITSNMLNENEIGFVNAVLDRIAKNFNDNIL